MYSKSVFTQILNNIMSINATLNLIASALTAIDTKTIDSLPTDQDLADLQKQLDDQGVILAKTQDDIKAILAKIGKKGK